MVALIGAENIREVSGFWY